MQVMLLLQLLILLVVANGAAVVAKKLFRGSLPARSMAAVSLLMADPY